MKHLCITIGFLLIMLLAGCNLIVQTTTPTSITPSATINTPTQAPVLTSTNSPVPPTPTTKPGLTLKKGPYILFNDTPNVMNVVWQSESDSEYTFEWGLTDIYELGSSVPTGDPETGLYQVRLAGLQPGTCYFYRVSTVQAEVRGSFVTPTVNSDSLTFYAYGDTRSGPETYDEISASILQQIATDPSAQTFTISTGDLMNIATEESLQENVFAENEPNIRSLLASMPIVNIMGNHDGTVLFKKYFPYPFTPTYDWSFDYGPAHFTIIDLYIELIPGSDRWFWLKNDLSASKKPWKFILLHEPGWSAGHHENNLTVQKIIHPLAVSNGVQVIIAGHNHYYSRAEVDGVTHITTGGGGAPLYDPEPGWPRVVNYIKAFHYMKFKIEGEILNVQVLSPQGEVLDEFFLPKKEIQ